VEDLYCDEIHVTNEAGKYLLASIACVKRAPNW